MYSCICENRQTESPSNYIQVQLVLDQAFLSPLFLHFLTLLNVSLSLSACLHVSNITSLSLSSLFPFVHHSSFIPSPSLSFAPLFPLCSLNLFLPHIIPLFINLPLSPLPTLHCISHISTSHDILLPFFLFYSLLLAPVTSLDGSLQLVSFWSISLSVYLTYIDPSVLTHTNSLNAKMAQSEDPCL